jgi:purine-cytosine permease-like protein
MIIIFSVVIIERKYVPENMQLAWDSASILTAGVTWAVTRYLNVFNNTCIILTILPVPLTLYCVYYLTLGRNYNEQTDNEAKYPWVREHRLKVEAEEKLRKTQENAKWWHDFANGVHACCIAACIIMGFFVFISMCIKHDMGIGFIFLVGVVGAFIYSATDNA